MKLLFTVPQKDDNILEGLQAARVNVVDDRHIEDEHSHLREQVAHVVDDISKPLGVSKMNRGIEAQGHDTARDDGVGVPGNVSVELGAGDATHDGEIGPSNPGCDEDQRADASDPQADVHPTEAS